MKLSTPLLAATLLPFLATLPTYAQDKDKSDKAADKSVATKAPEATRDAHSYRLLYTLTEMESGKKVGEQHFSLVVNADYRPGTIHIGSKIPVITGSYDSGNGKEQTQFQYIDVGLNINATLNAVPNGIQVASSVEQSSLGEATSAIAAQPVIRQTTLTSIATLIPGGHVQLGSLDIPGSTHHVDVELTLERVN
jgi:hypothetical protein